MRSCPTCAIRLGPDPFHHNREVMPDRKLQEIVHKIFPWMKAQEEEEERNFYLRRGIELKPEYQQSQQTEAATGVIVGTTHKKNKRNYDARVDESAANTTMSMVTMNDQIDVQLDPDITPPHPYQQLPPLQNARISISGRAKINTLKKYLIMKLGLKDTSISTLSSKVVSSSSPSSPTMIELTCNGDTMDDELTLAYILCTKWFTSNKVLTLKYRLLHQVEEKKKKGKK